MTMLLSASLNESINTENNVKKEKKTGKKRFPYERVETQNAVCSSSIYSTIVYKAQIYS